MIFPFGICAIRNHKCNSLHTWERWKRQETGHDKRRGEDCEKRPWLDYGERDNRREYEADIER